MKNTTTHILILLLFAALPTLTHAQEFLADVQNEVHLFNQSTAPSDPEPAFWFKVEKEANLPEKATHEDIEVADIQEIIYYATLYGERFDFRASVAQLLDVYRYHENESYRMMAVSALHAIGDRHGIEGLREAVRHQPSARIRQLTKAALKAYDEASAQ